MTRYIALVLSFAFVCAGVASAQQAPFTVDGNIALSSLASLCDNHLETMAETLEVAATTNNARSGDWRRMSHPIGGLEHINVPSVLFYARPDGTYWTLEKGLQPGKISDRPYFKEVMAGRRVVGELQVSRSTGKPVAVVAVPVKDTNGNVVGLLGGSIYLEQLSAQLAQEMGVGPNVIFWSVDSQGTIGIHSDPSNILAKPATMSPQLKAVMADMLAKDRGTDTYEFRGKTRTIIFEKSALTGWRYGFGVLR